MKYKVKFIHDNEIKNGYIKNNLNKFTKEFIKIEKGQNKYIIPIEDVIVDENNLEIQLEKHKIKNYSKQYNLTIKWINEVLYVTSLFDEWFIEPKNDYFLLQHIHNFVLDKKCTGKFHKQYTFFYSYFSALRHIAEHDENQLYNNAI
ncbi:non-specific serine/threonine protein kinase [Clostridium botulinum B str. Osaka05]|uniref:Non-specific serine/threonine protein kinase n=1 Tax=Clostridium botulinum B str. Osaka05 TaxID=1407017 RepID=A0A060N535_CLOBO|nr:hypothetical protein [Clostridium botulinum]BAO04992.1 non-specific serine/threonine protein kinase [Clostridium botulinum B str. Osaka05]